MELRVDTKTAKTIKTSPVHQWDKMVFLRFDESINGNDCEVHFDMPSGTGTIIDLGLHNTAMIPNELLGSSFDGDIHARLVETVSLAETVLCEVIIPVIPCQNAVGR